MGELQRPVVTAIEHLPKPPPKNYGSNETNTNDRWGVYPHYPRRFGDNLRNGLNWNTSISMNKEYIKNVILFLEENEQYGDDWSEEIKELKKLIAYADITEEEAQVITNGDKKLKEMLDSCNWHEKEETKTAD